METIPILFYNDNADLFSYNYEWKMRRMTIKKHKSTQMRHLQAGTDPGFWPWEGKDMPSGRKGRQ